MGVHGSMELMTILPERVDYVLASIFSTSLLPNISICLF